jgi:phenylacetate-coenzyme A ligase PaaK-like adenylate-forming protein
VIHHISTLKEGRDKIKLDKIIYTSEALTAGQKAHIYEVLGPVKICSVLGSAEAGPYGVSTPDLTPSEPDATHNDFIIDTRMTLIEILPLDYAEDKDKPVPELLPEGETGVIAQTVLTRLRNPVVRYITGDVGSLHPLPEQARSQIPESDLPYLRILRLQGRDRRFSFMWDGFDTRFDNLATLLSEEEYGVLQWQVILSKMEPSLVTFLEIRLLCKEDETSRQAVLARLRTFLNIYPPNERKFNVTFVEGLSGFELSKTGQKVIKFVDRSA